MWTFGIGSESDVCVGWMGWELEGCEASCGCGMDVVACPDK